MILEKERMSDLKSDLKALIKDWESAVEQNMRDSREYHAKFFTRYGSDDDLYFSKEREAKAAGYNSAKCALVNLLKKYE
jgi:hypothetical protein